MCVILRCVSCFIACVYIYVITHTHTLKKKTGKKVEKSFASLSGGVIHLHACGMPQKEYIKVPTPTCRPTHARTHARTHIHARKHTREFSLHARSSHHTQADGFPSLVEATPGVGPVSTPSCWFSTCTRRRRSYERDGTTSYT